MQAVEVARAERHVAARAGRSARSNDTAAAPRQSVTARLIAWGARVLGGLGRMLATRRRSRSSLEIWMTMDPRVLADIGVRRTDVAAVLYGGAPIEQLGAQHRPRAGGTPSGQLIIGPRQSASRLRLVQADDLDAAA